MLLFWCLSLVGDFPFLPFVVVNCEPPLFLLPILGVHSHDLSLLSTQVWSPPSDPFGMQCCTSDPVPSSGGQRTLSLTPSKLQLPSLPPRLMMMTGPLPLSRPLRSDSLRKAWSSASYRLRLDVQVPRATTMASTLLHLPRPSLIISAVALIAHDVC